MAITISLEPPSLTIDDSLEASIFAPPARLVDLDLATGEQIISRQVLAADPDEGVGARLRRLWQERGDFSTLTAQSIRDGSKDDDKHEQQQDDDSRPTPQEMRELSAALLEQLNFARGELTTALDLLSVISKPEEPPSVDPNALPLPQETLTLVPTAPPPPPSTDPADNPLASLPLALSLASIHKSATAFFAAAEQLLPSSAADSLEPGTSSGRKRSQPPNPWTTLLHLHSNSAHTLLPLGAQRGAALSGKGETKSAREVGIFYGAEEAAMPFRRAAVARVSDLEQELNDKSARFAGRKLVLRLEMDGEVGEAVWGPAQVGEGEDAVLSGLKERGRAAFAEELFAALSQETRNESSLKARLTLGKKSTGDAIDLSGHNWSLTLTMIHSPPPSPPGGSYLPSLLLPLLRLLFIQEYKNRRLAHIASQPSAPHSGPGWSRPILASLSALLAYVQRGRRVREVLEEVRSAVEGDEAELEFFGGGAEAGVWGVLKGEKELGARAVLRVGHSPQRVFHVSYSIPLPHAPPGAFTSTSATVVPPAAASPTPASGLTLQAKGGPIQIPSVEHLRLFLNEQVNS